MFYNLIHVFGEGGPRAHLVLIATAPRKPAFSHGVVQTVAAVAIFFFVNVTDGKPPFRQTQIFNNYFFEKNEKRAVFGEKKLSENRPEMVIRQSDSAWKVEIGEKYLFIFTFLRA